MGELFKKQWLAVRMLSYRLEWVTDKTKPFKTVRPFWVGCDHFLDTALFQWYRVSLGDHYRVKPSSSSTSGVCGPMQEDIIFSWLSWTLILWFSFLLISLRGTLWSWYLSVLTALSPLTQMRKFINNIRISLSDHVCTAVLKATYTFP